MRLLSWDVGIINLSYCLIEYDNINKDNQKWEIIDWNIINLTNRHEMICYQCGAKPSFVQQILNTKNKYTCKNHMKNINTIPDNFEDLCLLNENSNEKCQFEGRKHCEKTIKYTFHDKKYCNTHAKSEYKKYAKSFELKPFTKKAVRDINLDELRLKLIRTLDDKPLLLTATQVLIENQPTLKNPRMKAISSTLYDYYLIRGIIDKDITNSNINLVKYMCPSNKLKLADDGDTQKLIKLKGNDAKTYKLTKSLGIKYCSEMIKNNEKWSNHFNFFKKKDDMADSFLQGIYYIYN
jgi:hypothetical protein